MMYSQNTNQNELLLRFHVEVYFIFYLQIRLLDPTENQAWDQVVSENHTTVQESIAHEQFFVHKDLPWCQVSRKALH